MSNFLGSFPTYTQLPPIDQVNAAVGDISYTLDDGVLWNAKVPSNPPFAAPEWFYVDTLRGSPGPEGPPGVGIPGPQGMVGPMGSRGSSGPMGPAGKSSFSYLSEPIRMPAIADPPINAIVTDTSWMQPGQLLYVPNAGTFTVIGAPLNPYTVQLTNSGDSTNAPAGTLIGAGNLISPANLRGPSGGAGPMGPKGDPGPQGVGGAAAFTSLTQAFTIPSAQGTAFVQSAATIAAGLIVYIANGDYFSVVSSNVFNNTIVLQNLSLPGGAAVGTVIPIGATVSGVGPRGPQGDVGPMGPAGIQGLSGTMPTGTITMFGGTTAPGGWLFCYGQEVAQAAFPSLYAIISGNFNDGTEHVGNFRLPVLQNRFPLGKDPGTALVLGALGGAATVALSIAQLPVFTPSVADHSHAFTGVDHQHPFTGVNHTHQVTGVNHLHDLQNHFHGVDHYHNIVAGQFTHAHNIQPFGIANIGFQDGPHTLNTWQQASAYSTLNASLPAGSTTTAGATNSAWAASLGPSINSTGAADRSLVTTSGTSNQSLASTTGAADRSLSSTTALAHLTASSHWLGCFAQQYAALLRS